MDKNSILGIVLMAAIIIGFMVINQPSEEQLKAQREQAEKMAEAERAKSDTGNVLRVDSINGAELTTIANTVREFGRRDTVSSVTTLSVGDADITLSADGALGGTVDAGNGKRVAIADLAANRWDKMTTAEASAAVTNLRAALADAARYRGFARYISGDSTTVKLANKLLTLEISNKGASIARATLNDYKAYDSTRVELMSPETDHYSFTLTSANQHFDTDKFYFTPTLVGDSAVVMALDLGDGARFGIRYTLSPDSYLVKMDVIQEGMQTIIPSSVASMDFNWSQKMRRLEAGRVFEERNSALYYMFLDGNVENLSENSSEAKDVDERFKWVGYKNQFFSTVMMARTNFSAASFDSQILENDPNFIKTFDTRATLEYSSTQPNPASFVFYMGPNSYPLMSDIESNIFPEENMHLTKVIPLGWSLFRWINTLIVIPVFSLLGSFISSYGLIILLLTIFIKLILFPFTYKSYMSQARMRVLAPEVKAINDKYPGQENAMKRQQETMALYSRAGANPMSGCLPMLLQMPILIAMFSFFPSAIELRGESFLWAKDLSAPDAIVSWTANIPFISSTFGNHISLFCLLMTVTNILYTRITMQNQPSSSSMPAMKWMMYLMPLMFLFFFNNYAAGLSYYYFLSLLITIVQTYIFRKVVNEEKVRAKMAENAKKPRKKSGFMARLEEAQKRQEALMREQAKANAKRRR